MAARETFGDAGLATGLRDLLRGAHPAAAVGVVTPSGTRVASYTAPLTSEYETGQLSQGITGLLYADAVARGSVRPGTALGELLPLDGCDAAGVDLASLAAHRSGLPRAPKQPSETFVRTWHLWVDGENPYGDSLEALLAQTRATPVAPRSATSRSDLGFMLLGHALAAAEGTTYADLLRRRLADPVGMVSTYVAAQHTDLRPDALSGRSRSGRRREAWLGEGVGPAAGVRSSIQDLALLVAALLDGSAPGIAALDPLDPSDPAAGPARPTTAGWTTALRRGRAVTWCSGRSGGFASWCGLDRAAGTGVVILTATAAAVDRQGLELLHAVTPG